MSNCMAKRHIETDHIKTQLFNQDPLALSDHKRSLDLLGFFLRTCNWIICAVIWSELFFSCPPAGPEEDSGDPGPGEEAAAAEAHVWSPTSTAPQEVKIQQTWRNGDRICQKTRRMDRCSRVQGEKNKTRGRNPHLRGQRFSEPNQTSAPPCLTW